MNGMDRPGKAKNVATEVSCRSVFSKICKALADCGKSAHGGNYNKRSRCWETKVRTGGRFFGFYWIYSSGRRSFIFRAGRQTRLSPCI